MTAVLDATPDAPTTDTAPADPPASWAARLGAFALDVLLGVAVIVTMALLALGAPQGSWLWWVFTAAAAVTVVLMGINRWLLPTMTGWSLGRGLFGIRVVRRAGALGAPPARRAGGRLGDQQPRGDGSDAGVWRLLARDLAHLLDTAALFIGWLWPLWDRRGRTFADLLLRTEVHRVPRPERDMRRQAAMVLTAAVLACALAVGLSFLVVYRQERAVEQSRAQIAEQGPRIVEQMLSYGVDSMQDDFSRAQSLATDAYRPQLVAQQEAVHKGAATTNEYWAVSSAVLSVSKDKAAMLLAMQGQRGANAQDLKFITATVRADFEKTGDNWRVANLTVLKKPQMSGAGQ